jgi:predicted ATPase
VYALGVEGRLKRIQIKGFKSIKDCDLELKPLNVLIGANGAGKSNFISFFKMLDAMNRGEFELWSSQSPGGAAGILYLNPKFTTKIVASIEYQTEKTRMLFRFVMSYADTSEKFLFVREEFGKKKEIFPNVETDDAFEYELYSPRLLPSQMAFRSQESALSYFEPIDANAAEARNVVRQILFGVQVYQFHDTSTNSRIRLTQTVDDDVSLKSDGGNLAAVLYRLKKFHTKHYKHIVKTIQLTAPFFKDFVLEPNGQNIRLRYSEIGSDTVFGAHQISDGTLRFMALMTLLLQPLEQMPKVIIIDEPELGLHPHALELLLSIMRRISKNRQIIVSTQSVSLVDRLEPEDIVIVERHNSETQFKRLDDTHLSEWLEEYSLGELWEKNVLGGRPSR